MYFGMARRQNERSADCFVETCDLAGPDWHGEIAFYREIAAEARSKGGGVLEIGWGTGRVVRHLYNWRELSI